MKKHIFLVLFFAIFSLSSIYSVGGGTESYNSEIPNPPKNFSLTVKDITDTETTLSNVTLDGKLFIEATYGKGKVTVPFEDIEKIIIDSDKKQGNLISARIFLRDGNEVEVYIRGRKKLYGKSPLGNYTISLQDVLQINFQLP